MDASTRYTLHGRIYKAVVLYLLSMELDAGTYIGIADRSGAEIASFGGEKAETAPDVLANYEKVASVLKMGPLREVVHVHKDCAEVYSYKDKFITSAKAETLDKAYAAEKVAQKLVAGQ